MPKFAIYFVPPQSEFYRIGASIVGYDMRARQPTTMAQQIARALGCNPLASTHDTYDRILRIPNDTVNSHFKPVKSSNSTIILTF